MITSVGENERLKASHTAGGDIKQYNHWENNQAVAKMLSSITLYASPPISWEYAQEK